MGKFAANVFAVMGSAEKTSFAFNLFFCGFPFILVVTQRDHLRKVAQTLEIYVLSCDVI